MLTLCLREICK